MADSTGASASAPEVSGRAFLGIIRHLKEGHGQAELDRTVASSPAPTQRVFGSRILHASWYPYEGFIGFLTALQARFGAGDPDYGRRLGEFSGKRDINTVFRIYLAIASPERLIRSCSKVWPSYYRNAGEMNAVTWSPEGTALRITGFPSMAPIHCRLMEGWMIATMNALGLEVQRAAREWETHCPSRGDPHHEFACTWTRKRS